MTLALVADVLGIVGVALLVVAGVGANRLGDVFARLHAATVGTTSGLVLVLLAGVLGAPSLRRLGTLGLALLIVVATIPTAGHLLARSVRRTRHGGAIPRAPRD